MEEEVVMEQGEKNNKNSLKKIIIAIIVIAIVAIIITGIVNAVKPTPEKTVVTEISITPKTGMPVGGVVLTGCGIGLGLAATNVLVSKIQMNKVVGSKKKFKKKSKKRTR